METVGRMRSPRERGKVEREGAARIELRRRREQGWQNTKYLSASFLRKVRQLCTKLLMRGTAIKRGERIPLVPRWLSFTRPPECSRSRTIQS